MSADLEDIFVANYKKHCGHDVCGDPETCHADQDALMLLALEAAGWDKLVAAIDANGCPRWTA